MTAEGPTAVEECIAFMEGASPVPPLDLVGGLSKAAEDHLLDIGAKGLASHVGSDGSSMQVRDSWGRAVSYNERKGGGRGNGCGFVCVQDRIERWGNWKDVIGENLDFCNEDPMDIVLSLLVDDNVPSRGHRKVR